MNNNPLTLAAIGIGAFICTMGILSIRRNNAQCKKETDDFIKKSKADSEAAIKDFEQQTGIEIPRV